MSDTKFTPGPWRAAPFSSVVGCPIGAQPDPKKNTIIVAGTRSAVAQEPGAFRAEVEANSYLIAAAPEMYEALVLLDSMDGWTPEDEWDAAWQKARAALAKARGESHDHQ